MLRRDYLTIVSGLPRSGTSMMMRMLETGGMPVVTDNAREADQDNPRGYYEFEPVKKTQKDASWVGDAQGKAVKMVYRLLFDLPQEYTYRVLFMRRNMPEILASQRKMLERSGKDPFEVSDKTMADLFDSELSRFQEWIAEQANFRVLEVSYNRILSDAPGSIREIDSFLDSGLDTEAMQSAIEENLYRNRFAAEG